MSESHKALMRRFLREVLEGGNLALIDELYAPDFVNHGAPAGAAATRDGLRGFIAKIRGAIPDAKIRIDHLVAEGDMVVLNGALTGTHKGSLYGETPTGKQVESRSLSMHQVRDGRFVARWHFSNHAEFMKQLGAAK
jgi:steroid delta-isomerase-like uncharacterized protein